MGLVDHDPASGDVGVKAFEFVDFVPNQLLESRGNFHASKVDLQAGSHRSSFRAGGAWERHGWRWNFDRSILLRFPAAGATNNTAYRSYNCAMMSGLIQSCFSSTHARE